MTPAQAAKAVAMLQAAYPAARWSEPTIALYELMLAELDYDVARNAVTHIIRTSKFLPTIAEVLEAAAEVGRGREKRISIAERIAADERERAADRAARGLPPIRDEREAVRDPAELDRLLASIGNLGGGE